MLTALESLDLNSNSLEDFNGILHAQSRLNWLNISHNRLSWFDYAFIPHSLQYLDIHQNEIDALGNYYNTTQHYELKMLDVSHNR